MEISILDAITQVGFPVAACIALFFLYDRSQKAQAETLTRIETMLSELSAFIKNLDAIVKKRENEKEG